MTPDTDARTRRPLLGALLLTLGVALLGWYVVIPWPWGLDSGEVEETSVMRQRAEEARRADEPFELRHDWVPLDSISRNLQRAVVTAEDDRFLEHEGVDWRALGEELRWTGNDTLDWSDTDDWRALAAAVRYGLEHREELRGRSTITQQVAKNLYFGTDRSLLRKGLEIVVAGRMERTLGKDRILEIYLNVAELGPGIFGAEAAAREYFGRSAADLGLAQAAALAGTLPHPLTSNPVRNPAEMRWRQQRILERLTR